MDDFGYPFDHAGEPFGPFTTLSYLIAFMLCLTTCLLSLSRMSEAGPDIGEIVNFDPREGPKHWQQPGIQAHFVATGRDCLLMPSVISVAGGSFIIEAKQPLLPPVFLVHWSGVRTDMGDKDCGRSADLTLPLVQLRALANVAGGFGVEHGFFWR
jgi:hypothetical protein